MSRIQIIEPKTPRLQLRQWTPGDRDAFAAMSVDPRVMEYFPSTLTRTESDAIAETCEALIAERGWGVWAVELLKIGEFIGMTGLHIPSAEVPYSPCVEILWRFSRPQWGNGYATEAAAAALTVGFKQLAIQEIVSFAAVNNHRSRAVMERINMVDSGETFEHPEIPESSPLREHCLYKFSVERWWRAVVW